MVGGIPLWFPKDTKAGGTWLGVSGHKRCVCLLNGGFEAHKMGATYRKSRGIVVMDLLVSQNLVQAIQSYNLQGIEPFTLIAIDWSSTLQLYELVWDGIKAHFCEKEIAPTIWSSALLYAKPAKLKREQWFESFIRQTSTKISEKIFIFHKTAGDGDSANDLIMNRTFVKTKSISQIVFDNNEDEMIMKYEDLEKQITVKNNIEI